MAAPHVAGAVALYIAAHGRATNAAGVAAIRQALINLAQPQSAWGSANTADPDANHESLVYVASIAPASNNAPVVTITAPADGSSFANGSAISFAGTATDAEDGNRAASLVWISSIDGQIGTGGSFSKVLSAGTHTITATASDTGGKTGSRSIGVTVQPLNAPPVVNITAPTNGSSFASGVTISFSGTATDLEDGNRTASLVWTSSIDGQIGAGGSFSKVLSAGTHTIAATATDSGGRTSTRSITITVLSALRVAVTTNKSAYLNRNKVYITAIVTDGVNPVSGVAAHLEVLTPNGNRITKDTVTDASGVARFQYTIFAKRDGYGGCSATVTVSKAGYNPGSGSVTYTVMK